MTAALDVIIIIFSLPSQICGIFHYSENPPTYNRYNILLVYYLKGNLFELSIVLTSLLLGYRLKSSCQAR
jgi:hypothetical protein